MSYILEALKKSEQEREREKGTLPDIKSIHTPSASSEKEGRRWWPFVLVGVVLVTGAGLGVFYLTNIQQIPTDVASLEEAEPTGSKESAISEKPAEPPKTKSADTTPVEKPVVAKTEPNKSKVVFSKQQLQHDNEIGNAAEQVPNEPQTASIDSTGGNVVEDIAIPISEIPDNIRQSIPRIAFEGHVYSSTPTRRSVMINGHKMREGDAIGENLMLKEITPEGAEFEYKGYRFKLNALQDWSFN